MSKGARYRVCNIELTEEQYFTLQRYIPHGMKRKIFGFIVEDLISELEKDAPKFLAGIYTRDLKLKDFMKEESSG
jgi:hypothetical protein